MQIAIIKVGVPGLKTPVGVMSACLEVLSLLNIDLYELSK